MAANDSQDSAPTYTFQSISPSDQFLEMARIHHPEAKQLFENADKADAEGVQDEAKLLMDVAILRRERAEEFERAARGECGDPVVSEINDGLEETKANYVPYAPSILTERNCASLKCLRT
jgi:acyl-CoA reductase-like NAD-dependent aldehyde dehydrogenase